MRILIAGGGIGGLSAAIGLGRLGHEVLVLEQASEPKPVGAGISLQPNAMQALATIRLDSEISKRGCAASGGVLMHTNGGIIRRFDFSGHMQRHGFLPHTIHRAALFDVLATAAAGAQVDLRYGQVVKSFVESDGKVVVRTTAGDSIPADALIGADGINSKIREQLWGKENRRYSGYVCWRGVVSTAKKAGSLDTMTEIWGKGARFGFMPCSPTEVYWFATKSLVDPTPNFEWRSFFRDWPEPVAELIEATPSDSIAFNDISDRVPRKKWGRGNVTLLGDAAHPMTPNFGQGGAQAIEDAVVLSRAVEATAGVKNAFRRYEAKRIPRANPFVRASRQYGKFAQGSGVIRRFVRDVLLPMTPDFAMQRTLSQQFDFRSHLDR